MSESLTENDLLSMCQAAEVLGCSTSNLRFLILKGIIAPHLHTAIGRLFLRSEVEALAARRAAEKEAAVAVTPAPGSIGGLRGRITR